MSDGGIKGDAMIGQAREDQRAGHSKAFRNGVDAEYRVACDGIHGCITRGDRCFIELQGAGVEVVDWRRGGGMHLW